jgi:hypothetical protein
MTTAEILRLYKRADYDEPKLLQVLADVCGVTMDELKKIIEEKVEMAPKGTRWTNEQRETYRRMTAEGKSDSEVATAIGVDVGAIRSKRYNDKKYGKAPAPLHVGTIPIQTTIDTGTDSEFDRKDCEYETPESANDLPEPLNIPDIDIGENITDINKAIEDLCETPEPLNPVDEYPERPPEPKPDPLNLAIADAITEAEQPKRRYAINSDEYISYANSLIETLRDGLESDHIHWLKLNGILSEYETKLREAEETIDRQNKMITDYQHKEESEQIKSKVHIGMDRSDAADAFANAILAMSNLNQSIAKAKIKSRTIYDITYATINRLKETAEQSDIDVSCIIFTINKNVVDVSASNECGECVGWHKKYQPTECKSAD